MKNLIKKFNELSISQRLIIMFTLPQILLASALIYTLKENQGLDISALFILMTMGIIVSLYYLIVFSITRPLTNAVTAGLDSIDHVMDEFMVERTEKTIQDSDSKSEITQTINKFFALASELDDIVDQLFPR